jgi:hypothetical protein
MAARKSTKTPSRKTDRKQAPAGKKAPAKAAPEAAASGDPAAADPPRPAEPKQPADEASGKASSTAVNMGHIFGLRPRVRTSFRQADFRTARQQLQDEAYESIQDAARAVAEKALELTHDGGTPKRGTKPDRR